MQKYDFVYIQNYTSMSQVKDCVIISIEEIIDVLKNELNKNDMKVKFNLQWWNSVKNEVDKLD
jgi:hypothetical protein